MRKAWTMCYKLGEMINMDCCESCKYWDHTTLSWCSFKRPQETEQTPGQRIIGKFRKECERVNKNRTAYPYD